MKELSKDVLVNLYEEYNKKNPDILLDKALYEIFDQIKENDTDSFDKFKAQFLKANNINEYDYYTQNVRPEIKKYVEENVFPQYAKNDQGHGILHILEVIRRSFVLASKLNLDLDDNMIYVIAACHDWGKYEELESRRKTCKNCSEKICK